MTAQEAIRILKTEYLSDSEQMELAKQMGAIALEKQILKKPDYEGDGYDENGGLIYDTAYCPECHHEFEYGVNDWGVEHCPCGQAFDWSGE
ncbi:MAG: hypothetical protein ACI4IR_06950 [Eubacterium sp.]